MTVVPATYTIDEDAALTIVVWDGEMTNDDLAVQMQRLLADPAWPPGKSHLADLTTATTVPDLRTPAILRLAEDDPRWRGIRYAIVARTGWEHATAFQRALASLGLGQVIVFNDVSTACTWLGVDDDAVRAEINELRARVRTSS